MRVIEVLKGREYSLSEIIEYYYKIIENRVAIEDIDKINGNLVYGIQIDKILIEKSGEQTIESEKVEIISCNLELVREICKVFHKNLVSPIHLVDVLEDNISKLFKLDSKIRFVENAL